ncbi:MAG TPA: glycoside hydrolase family 127 protein, partial [bacterium]|nr:glycoside hydrolase family 127 protein [bacterium]
MLNRRRSAELLPLVFFSLSVLLCGAEVPATALIPLSITQTLVVSEGAKMMYKPVPFSLVEFDDNFWAPRLRRNREWSIPHVYWQLKEHGQLEAFRHKTDPTKKTHIFWDSDLAKWMEGVSYCLMQQRDSELEATMDEIVSWMADAQLEDGYLNSHFIAAGVENRWKNLRVEHELYCAGHLIEAAVAYYEATGKKRFLDIICRYVDHIDATFGSDKRRGYPGHEEIELALVKLYRVTGEQKYLHLSQFFLEERGQQPHYYNQEALERGEDEQTANSRTHEELQAHKPIREQTEVAGHAVRAMYLYSAMADVAMEMGDDELFHVCEQLWENLTTKYLYITAGIGSTSRHEGFTVPYDLPNENAYSETCASLGLVFWNHRMLQRDCDSRYADLMEQALYNSALSGVSLGGRLFFYTNPLASRGDRSRQPWFGCSCCPTNIVRFIASVGQYFYSHNADQIAVHLYANGTASIPMGSQTVQLTQQTKYPWDGKVTLTLGLDAPAEFTLKLRIPGWCKKASLRTAGKTISIQDCLQKGYVCMTR